MASTQGSRVKEVRKRFRLSQRELADKINVDQSAISLIENKGTASTDVMYKISTALCVNMSWLISGEGEMVFENKVAPQSDTIPVKEALEIAERMTEKVRADYNERISELNRTIEFLMTLVKDKKKVA